MTNLLNQEENWAHYRTAKYDWHQLEHSTKLDPRQQAIADLIEPASDVLDLGCADGTLLVQLWNQKKLHKGYGCEICEGNVVWGNDYAQARRLPIWLHACPAEQYRGLPVDYVVIGEVLEHVIDPLEVLKVARAHSSKVIITVPIARPPITPEEIKYLQTHPNEHVREYDAEQLLDQCTNLGLHVTSINKVGTTWVSLVVLVTDRYL